MLAFFASDHTPCCTRTSAYTRDAAISTPPFRRPVVHVTLHTVYHTKHAAYFQYVSATFHDESSSGGIQTRFVMIICIVTHVTGQHCWCASQHHASSLQLPVLMLLSTSVLQLVLLMLPMFLQPMLCCCWRCNCCHRLPMLLFRLSRCCLSRLRKRCRLHHHTSLGWHPGAVQLVQDPAESSVDHCRKNFVFPHQKRGSASLASSIAMPTMCHASLHTSVSLSKLALNIS